MKIMINLTTDDGKEYEGTVELIAKDSAGTNKHLNVSTSPQSHNYKGLVGGIHYLVDNGFFDSLHSLSEIQSELKREGYTYSDAAVSKILTKDFTNKKKILSRIKVEKLWKYVKRK